MFKVLSFGLLNQISDQKPVKCHILDYMKTQSYLLANLSFSSISLAFSAVLSQGVLIRSCKIDVKTNEPRHVIMVLFVLQKLILQTRMCSLPVTLDV